MNEQTEAVTEAQGEHVQVPVSRLRASTRNARSGKVGDVSALAASIQHVGLINPITVSRAEDGTYEVEAGRRRMEALKLLQRKKVLPKNHSVPCRVVESTEAQAISLSENVHREAMHPADEFEAFQKLTDEGRPVEDIAAMFGVTPLVVRRRLKLANLSAKLMSTYRAGKINLDQMIALTVSSDHKAQEAAFFDVPHYLRGAHQLRQRLMQDAINAKDSHLVKLVGLQAYKNAGGSLKRDLFEDEDHPGYIEDAELLGRLAGEILEAERCKLEAEGWKWTEWAFALGYDALASFKRMQPRSVPLSEVQQSRAVALAEQLEALELKMDQEDDPEVEAAREALDAQWQFLTDELDALNGLKKVFDEECRKVSGAIVYVENNGTLAAHRGLLRPEDLKAAKDVTSGAEDSKETPAANDVSERLARQLTAHRTVALQAELSWRPDIALAGVVHRLVVPILREATDHWSTSQFPADITGKQPCAFHHIAPDLKGSKADAAMSDALNGWKQRLPQDLGQPLFDALVAMPTDELLVLLAFCTAWTLNLVSSNANRKEEELLPKAVDLDMRRWWTATGESYFSHVSKRVILKAVEEFAPKEAERLAKLKKAELVAEAERLAAPTGWLPEILRGA